MNTYFWFVVAICLGGIEAQSCKFPCYWRGKTFQLYHNGQPLGYNWTFSADGHSLLQAPNTLECFEIFGEFILARYVGTGYTFCALTDIFDENTFTVFIARGAPSFITDLCLICDIVGPAQLTAPEAPFPNCTKPSICSGEGVCPADRSLDIGTCDAQSTTTTTTTPAATTTTTPATTPMRNCRRRHHSRGYNRKHHRG